MTDRIKIPLGAIWEEALAFVRAEIALLAPLAFLGFGLPMVVLELVAPQQIVQDGTIAGGPWLFWLIPYGLLSLMGTLSISALALTPGISVRESLNRAVARLPAALGIILVAFGAMILLSIPISIVAAVEMGATGKVGAASMLAYMAALATMIWAIVRLLPIWATLMAGTLPPWAALRRVFVLTRGRYLTLLALRLVAWLSQILLAFVLLLPIAAVFGVIGRLVGNEQICQLIALLLSGVVIAAIMALWTVYVARLYRRLDA